VFVLVLVVCGQIHEEAVFRTIAQNIQNEIFSHQWLAPHERDHPAAYGFKPIDRALGCFQIHAGLVVVILKTIVAVYVALPLCEEIAKDGPKIVGMYP
jgi:hypothetical protein